MKNELKVVFKESDIIYTKEKIYIEHFESLKNQVEKISTYIKNSKVNEESIKETKKILAKANKTINIIDTVKKQIKKEVMKPYEYFESQVKELLNEIKEAEEGVRKKVRDLEENQRAKKELTIKNIFEKRNRLVYLINWLKYDKFLKNEHLNKSYSIKKIEEEMVIFFERVKKDLDVLKKMENTNALLAKYQEKLDLAVVLNENQEQKKVKAQKAFKLPCKVSITLTQAKPLKTLLNILEEHLIDYEIEQNYEKYIKRPRISRCNI